MEYIPDGLTKAQWEAMKKKEVEANKGKNLGAVGITKFQSRSFEGTFLDALQTIRSKLTLICTIVLLR